MFNDFLPQIKIPESTVIDSPLQHLFVDEQFQILKKYIQEYESTLDADNEVALWMTNFGQSVVMQVTEISYAEPVLLIFKGFINGKPSTLIQHMNQLNFLLTSVKKQDDSPKKPIGFIVPED